MQIVSYAIQSLKLESAPLVQKLLPLLFARFQQVTLPQSDTADADKVILKNLGQFVRFFQNAIENVECKNFAIPDNISEWLIANF